MRTSALVFFWLVCCGGNKATTTTPPPQASASTAPSTAPIVQQMGDAGVPRVDPAAIREVVRAGMVHFKLCYIAALKKQKGLSGRVETRFVIDETGHVASAEDVTHSNVLQDDDARACVVAKFKQLEFPPPQPSGKVPIDYPILFDPTMVAEEMAPADAGVAQTDPAQNEYNRSRLPFNAGNAFKALGAVDVKPCGVTGFHGAGHVKVTFDPSGVATKAEVDAPASVPPAATACISKLYLAARMPVFAGSAVTVGKNFTVP